MDEVKLEDVQIHSESFPLADEPSEDGVFNEYSAFYVFLPTYTPPLPLAIKILPSQLR